MAASIEQGDGVPPGLPPVCVVTVCRNALADLRLTAASVRQQTYPQLHYLVVDGASSDGTPAFLRAAGDDIDDWVTEPDGGIYDAMNKAIQRCPTNSWVVFLNAGDRFADDNVLQRLAGRLVDGVDMVFGGVAVRSAGGAARPHRAGPVGTSKMPGCHQSMLVRAALLVRHRFDTGFKVGADFEFYLRATRAGARVALFDGVVAEVAPEGFSAANEDILQHDYSRAITLHRGRRQALLWLAARKCRRALHRLRLSVSQGPV